MYNVALEAVRWGWNIAVEKRWALILLDLRFVSGYIGDDGEPEGQTGDDTFGLLILDAVHDKFLDIPTVIISSRERAEVIVLYLVYTLFTVRNVDTYRSSSSTSLGR